MSRFGDIIWMIIGIVMLIVVSTSDTIRFRFGVIGYIGAFACIGWGIKAIIDNQKDKEAMNMEILSRPDVKEFYENTKRAWNEGKLNKLSSAFKSEGKSYSVEKLMKNYLPYDRSALNTYFNRFNPEPGEFLVGLSHGTKENENSWFVMTNRRLIIKSGETGEFKEFKIDEIKDYETSVLKSEVSIKTVKDEIITLKKTSYFPQKKYVNFLREAKL